MNKHINVKITGKVQGVGFRFSAYEKFVDLGLVGKAENIADGVLVDTEGPDDKLDALIEWCFKPFKPTPRVAKDSIF
jgi:acylphosphatase